MSHSRTAVILNFAKMSREAIAMNEAILGRDFDEARFRAHLIRVMAAESECTEVWRAARDVSELLGETGGLPRAGYGQAVLRLADRLRIPA